MLYVQGPLLVTAVQQRLTGMREALRSSKLREGLISGDWLESKAAAAVDAWFSANAAGSPLPSVIGCQNDAMALGAMRPWSVWRRREGIHRSSGFLSPGVTGHPTTAPASCGWGNWRPPWSWKIRLKRPSASWSAISTEARCRRSRSGWQRVCCPI